MSEIRFVRVYCTEGEKLMQKIFARLHDVEKVRGVTVFRGISGFGKSGVVHSASLLDMSLDLPIVIEFFDNPDKVGAIIKHLNEFIEPGHIVSWPAKLEDGE